MDDFDNVSDLMVIEKKRAPEDGTDFFYAELTVMENFTFLPFPMYKLYKDFFLTIILENNFGRRILTREEFKVGDYCTISNLIPLPACETKRSSVVCTDESLIFKYNRKARTEHLVRVIQENGKCDDVWEKPICSFLGLEKDVNLAVDKKLNELQLTNFYVYRNQVWPRFKIETQLINDETVLDQQGVLKKYLEEAERV